MGAPTDREMFRAMGRECAAYRIRRASRVVTRMYDHALADAGLNATQLTLLSAVANRPDLRMAELAELLGFEPSSLSRSLALLAKKRWIKATPTSDKRERFFEITEKGREVARKGWTRWQSAQDELKRVLGAEQLAQLLKSLDLIKLDDAQH